MIYSTSNSKKELEKITTQLTDPLAKNLAGSVHWLNLNGISKTSEDLYPVAIVGKGKPILLLHGFDSCFLEFRRLIPFLKQNHQLIIPDLFGFGFCPRPKEANYGITSIIQHLVKLLDELNVKENIGIIGASMGGGVAMEFSRQNINNVDKLLLLSPAGLIDKPSPIPWPLDQLGVCFLKQKFVRESLCKNAFFSSKNVGPSEKQIASIHIDVPGWGRSLAAFARGGGVANCGIPLPKRPIAILWGSNDKILNKRSRIECQKRIDCFHEEVDNCGHLPHIDRPELVANRWNNFDKII